MRRLALLLLIAVIPTQAWAFSSDDLLATIAMPLAVAAVSDVPGVPSDGLSDLVVELNQANVPPARFVEVIRYVPVAFVDQNGRPFIQYVQEQRVQGVTGDALVTVINNRLQTQYDVAPAFAFREPATTFVVQDDYIPPVVVTRMSTVSSNDPLAFIALPLAVAAVANIIGVPQDELASLVATLNGASVPPTQVIQVLRYAPVALVADNGQPFLQFVRLQTTNGITGTALMPVIVDELRTYYPPQTQITVVARQQPVFVERDFVPPVVTARVAEFREHPHGGPPGQLKKQLGLQTGAEVVHGSKPGRDFRPASPPPVIARENHRQRHEHPEPPPMISSSPPAKVKKHGKEHSHATPRVIPPTVAPTPVVAPPRANPPGRSKGHDAGGPPSNPGKQHGKGGGKGHGKG